MVPDTPTFNCALFAQTICFGMPTDLPAFECSALDSAAQSLLGLVYEEALTHLRDHQVETTQGVRNDVAKTLWEQVVGGERNSYVLLEHAISAGFAANRREVAVSVATGVRRWK